MAPALLEVMIQLLSTVLALSFSIPGLPPAGAGDSPAAPPASGEPASRQGVDQRLEARFGAGDDMSPVTLLLYAPLEGERSGALVSALYREVSVGRLKGKVKLAFRPLLPENRGDEVARAVTAAAEQGMLWPYLVRVYGEQAPIRRCTLRRQADLAGLDGDAFDLAYVHPDTDRFLSATRGACKRHHLTDSPGAFINGTRVSSELTAERLILLLEEEHVRHQLEARR